MSNPLFVLRLTTPWDRGVQLAAGLLLSPSRGLAKAAGMTTWDWSFLLGTHWRDVFLRIAGVPARRFMRSSGRDARDPQGGTLSAVNCKR